jgi:hypothetical protein
MPTYDALDVTMNREQIVVWRRGAMAKVVGTVMVIDKEPRK